MNVSNSGFPNQCESILSVCKTLQFRPLCSLVLVGLDVSMFAKS